MRTNLIKYSSLLFVVSALLAGCGQEEASNNFSYNEGKSGEAPQYLDPGMDQLRGKEQPFPSKFPVSRYPRTRVAFASVKPNLPAGYRNQVMLSAAEPSKDGIVRYYGSELQGGGWKKVYEWEADYFSSTKWQKDGVELEVRVSPDNHGKQNVQLFYGKVAKRNMPPRTP